MNQCNALHGDEPNEPPREWNSQPPEARYKSRTPLQKTNPAISDIIGRLNHCAIDNGDIKVHNSYFQLSLTMNQFQIQTPLRLNQLMTTKWTVSWDSSIKNMINIFWMLFSRCFKLDLRLPLIQSFTQYLLCCFINLEDRMLQSHIVCHSFYVFPTKATLKLANGNTGHAQVIGIIL